MKTTPVAVVVVFVLFSLLVPAGAQDKPPKAAGDIFETENFSLEAPKGALKKTGGNGLNTLVLHASNFTKGESPRWILKDNAPEGFRAVEVGRIEVEKPPRSSEERRAFVEKWAKSKTKVDEDLLDRDSIKNARWLEDGTQPRVLLRRVYTTPWLPQFDERTGDYVKSKRLISVGIEMLVFQSGGIYHVCGWGFAGGKLDRDKLAEQISEVLLSFAVKKETSLDEDFGFTFKAPSGFNGTRTEDGFYLSKPGKERGFDESVSWGSPRYFLSYRAENQLGTGDEEDPPLEGKKVDDVVKQFGRVFRSHAIDKAGMNSITASKVGNPAKAKFGGQDARVVEATFTFVTKHMREGGGFDVTRENMGATALMVETKRGVLTLLAVYLAKDKATMTTEFNAIRDAVKLEPSNIPEPGGK